MKSISDEKTDKAKALPVFFYDESIIYKGPYSTKEPPFNICLGRDL
ncbi:hypothetical protein M2140_001580 [Clostridiales Family XIII bacterium PM5-7]